MRRSGESVALDVQKCASTRSVNIEPAVGGGGWVRVIRAVNPEFRDFTDLKHPPPPGVGSDKTEGKNKQRHFLPSLKRPHPTPCKVKISDLRSIFKIVQQVPACLIITFEFVGINSNDLPTPSNRHAIKLCSRWTSPRARL